MLFFMLVKLTNFTESCTEKVYFISIDKIYGLIKRNNKLPMELLKNSAIFALQIKTNTI